MATCTKLKDLLIILIILQVLCIERCEAYIRSYPWWSMWYFWVIIIGVIACCFGAWGSYYRKRMLARAASGQRPQYIIQGTNRRTNYQQPYLTGAPPVSSSFPPASAYAPPTYPVVAAPQPPGYTAGLNNQAYQPGLNNTQDIETKKENLPPSYSELYGSGDGQANTNVA